MKAVILCAAMFLFLSGCHYHNMQNYASIDATQKTVTVPPGSGGLSGKLKQVLTEQGWKLSVYRGPSVMEGDLGGKTKLESYDTFLTRYRLFVNYSRYDTCLNFTPAINYDVSLIDNQSGSEVFTVDGHGCEGSAVDKFKEALAGVAK